MQFRFTKSRDIVGPALHKAFRSVSNLAPYHAILGEIAVQVTKQAFNNPGARPAPWAPLASGAPARLRRDNVLARSPRVISADGKRAIIGSDRKYAAIHQLGGTTSPHVIRARRKKALKTPYGPRKSVNHPGSKIPARPFFPFHGKRPSDLLQRNARAALRRALDRALLGGA